MPALCLVTDVTDRTSTALSHDALYDLIEAVSDEIEDYVGAWLAPREGTFYFDVERTGTTLRLTQGDRRVGVRSITAIEYATTSQPTTGGVYTAIPTTSIMLRPRPYEGVIASSIVLHSSFTGYFTRGFNTVMVTGSFGPETVAPRVREAAIQMVLADLTSRRGISSESIDGWSVTYTDNPRPDILSTLSSLTTVAL
jgi:hypothetical protein